VEIYQVLSLLIENLQKAKLTGLNANNLLLANSPLTKQKDVNLYSLA
jgi:hypothetical protein